MNTPIANVESLRIGNVDFVSPDEIKVVLDLDAPNDVALNSGVPRPFPRINSYVLIPEESGFLVAQIEWVTIERSQFPKRRGMKDFGVLDLPYPSRKMSVMPLGVLKEDNGDDSEETTYEFSRGIEVFPTVGDPVIIPTQMQLKAIVESGSHRRVNIGVSPMAGNAIVSVDPDRLFGRHLAVLGNTGSGKSCSVAGLLRWAIDAAKNQDLLDYTNLPQHITNYNFLLSQRDFMKTIQAGGEIKLHSTEWINKSSGRGNIKLIVSDSDGKVEEFDYPYWFPFMPYSEVFPRLFPWATFSADEEFYEASDEELWRTYNCHYDKEDGWIIVGESFDVFRGGLDPMRGIDHAGEVAEYMLKMGLNDLGEAFLTVNEFVSQLHPYVKARLE